MASPLGDRSRWRVVREQHELPKDREAVISEVARLLRLGGVTKLTVQYKQPIHVERIVVGDESQPLVEVETEDIYSAARNAEMAEFSGMDADVSAFTAFFYMFRAVEQRHLVPKALLVGSLPNLKKWLKLQPMDSLTSIFNVPVHPHGQVTEDALLFIAADPNTEAVEFSIRIPMYLEAKR
jgi:hypothetical protein